MDTQEIVAPESINNAEELRQALRAAELAVVDLRRAGPDAALAYVRLLDRIEEAVPRLEEHYGVNLKPEQTRLQTLENMTRSHASLVVREAGAGAFDQARQEIQPPAEHWWWYLDQLVAQRRQATVRRWSQRGLIAAGLLLVFLVLYNALWAPSEQEKAFTNLSASAESFLTQGELEEALDELEAAVALNPQDVGVRLQLGVVYRQLGREEEAEEQLAMARSLSPSEAEYRAGLSLVYYRIGISGAEWAVAAAEEEGLAAVEADDASAMAHFALASAYELKGDTSKAIQEFELASNLSSDPSLTVMARMRMGMLMQSPGDSMGGFGGSMR